MKNSLYIDTIIGTVGDGQIEKSHGGGKTYPGACVPGGMVQLSPDTVSGGDNGSGYNYCHNTIEGFSFNHMSGIGWYGDLGNIQVCPADPKYYLNTPLFKEIEIKLDKLFHSCKNGETLKIICDENPLDFPYIKSVKLNGKVVKECFLTYEEITSGGEVLFELSKEPCESF